MSRNRSRPLPPPWERDIESRARLAAIAECLVGDELGVLLEAAAGLAAGRKVYGRLDVATDERDYHAEALEEIRDGLVYVGAALCRLRGGER